jgi:heme/copper-type cytochrome/quinol oxidase subunit 3
MKKQFTLNLDALVVITLVFLLAISFIGYQRYQYNDLLQEHVQLQWGTQDMEINLDIAKAKLERCNVSE